MNLIQNIKIANVCILPTKSQDISIYLQRNEISILYLLENYYAIVYGFYEWWKCYTHFEKGVKGDNFYVFNSNFYLVAYHSKALLKRKIMTLWKVSTTHGSLSEVTSCLTLKGCHFVQCWRIHTCKLCRCFYFIQPFKSRCPSK